MAATHHETLVKVGLRVKVTLPNGVRYHYQNYSREPIVIQGVTHTFLPMAYLGVPTFLELDNTGVTAEMPNSPMFRDVIRANDGLRKAIVEVTRIFIDNPNAVAIGALLQVKSASVDYPTIELEMESPLNTINGNVPNRHFTQQMFPELPQRTDVNL